MEREAVAFAGRIQKTREERKVTTFQIATLGFYAVQSLIGLAQCVLILMGLKQMSRASEFRERQSERRHEEVMSNHAENMKKHEESMTALRTLIERTAK